MKWFRGMFMWSALGCLGVTCSASAQGTVWRAAEPAETRPASASVGLGRPTPLPAKASEITRALGLTQPDSSGPIQKASYVVRGAMPAPDEPKILAVPKDLPPLDDLKQLPATSSSTQPAPATPTPATAKPASADGGIAPKAAFQKIAAPMPATPGADASERIVILSDSSKLGDEQNRSLFGYLGVGDRRLFAQAEWLLWTQRGFHIPPLVTTANANDPPDTRGALGFNSTRLIYGDSNVLGGLRSGARFTLGYDFDPCGICGIEGSFFFLGRKTEDAFFASSTLPVIGRPFFNINNGAQDRELTTTPENSTGNLQVHASTSLWGAEINKRILLWNGCDFQITGLVGFRYLDLNERLRIEENTAFTVDVLPGAGLPPIFFQGDRTFVFDSFATHNRFYGGQLGIQGNWQCGAWSLDARVKTGLGVTHQTIEIDGGQRFNRASGAVQSFQGGLYALPGANIGRFSQNRFAVVPEVNLKVGYNLTDNVRVFVGYDFLYWSSVVRPGDQIDLALDANRIPNSGAPFAPAPQARPIVPFRTSSYWGLGLNAGLEFRY